MIDRTDKEALLDWEEFLESIRQSTPVEVETEEEKRARIKRLEAPGKREDWFKYYFGKFSFAEPAPFHIESSDRLFTHSRIYQARAWARGLAKSTRRMMEVFYLMFVKKFKVNCLLCSKSLDNAMRLLKPYRGQLQANQRLINDYGIQRRPGRWKANEFTLRNGSTFRAVGAEQNPRGNKEDELRSNVLIFDDIDDDEVCRNEERLDNVWKWIEEVVIPTVEISKPYYILFDNNIIAEDSIMQRALQKAMEKEIVNIRDDNNKSVWAKNTEEDIDLMLGNISYEAGQKEYFNNPMTTGKTFSEIKYGVCPPLKSLKFVVVYADPATSNKDMPGAKSGLSNSRKAVWIIGKKGNDYYVYYGFLDVMSNSRFVDCLYDCRTYISGATPQYTYIENNTLQDPFFGQVIKPLIYQKGNQYGGVLSVTPDGRAKPQKWFRVEGTLEPINRMGHLIFNIAEKDNPHMQRLVAQFKAAKPTSKQLDGPDAIEGGVHIISQKEAAVNVGGITTIKRPVNPKRL